MSDLLFPNERKQKMAEQLKTEEQIENDKLRERVELLEKEKELEEQRNQRKEKKKRRITKNVVQREMKKRQALAMRMRNIPTDEIAARLDISPTFANKLIREGIQELPEETNADMKKLLSRTMIKLLGNFEKIALEGGVKEAEVALKSISGLMKLCGLNIQKKEIDQINMNGTPMSGGIDVAELDLDLDTKRKILEAMRKKEKQKQENPVQEENIEDEQEDEEDNEV